MRACSVRWVRGAAGAACCGALERRLVPPARARVRITPCKVVCLFACYVHHRQGLMTLTPCACVAVCVLLAARHHLSSLTAALLCTQACCAPAPLRCHHVIGAAALPCLVLAHLSERPPCLYAGAPAFVVVANGVSPFAAPVGAAANWRFSRHLSALVAAAPAA